MKKVIPDRLRIMFKARVVPWIFLLLLLSYPVTVYSQNPDIRLLRSINSSKTLSSDKFFQFASNSNAYIVLGIPAGIIASGFIKHNDELLRNGCVVLVATGINSLLSISLKYSINRDRPFVTYPDITKKSGAKSPSFPSGHTSSAFATATSLSLAYPEWYIIVPSYTWACTVAYSRMHLGVHYPSDVLAGALVGAASAWLTHYVNRKMLMKGSGKSNYLTTICFSPSIGINTLHK